MLAPVGKRVGGISSCLVAGWGKGVTGNSSAQEAHASALALLDTVNF